MNYLLGGIEAGVRSDGRGLLDYRACVIESDTLLHANGSAIVVLGGLGRGNTTRVLGVVKAEVGRTNSKLISSSTTTSTLAVLLAFFCEALSFADAADVSFLFLPPVAPETAAATPLALGFGDWRREREVALVTGGRLGESRR